MEKEFEVILDSNTLDDYEVFLNKFENYKENLREIKLNQLLNEGKRIEFIVDIIRHPSGVYYLELENDDIKFDTSLKNVAAAIKDFKFILNGNKIDKLTINTKILTTPGGKELQLLLESGFEIIAKQLFSPNFVKFYLTYPNKSDIRDIKINKILD
jgi:hypothetical protein